MSVWRRIQEAHRCTETGPAVSAVFRPVLRPGMGQSKDAVALSPMQDGAGGADQQLPGAKAVLGMPIYEIFEYHTGDFGASPRRRLAVVESSLGSPAKDLRLPAGHKRPIVE